MPGMPERRSLLFLRHAHTESVRPGATDRARRLTDDGEREAAAVGDHLRDRGEPVDLVVCSSATRTRQTVERLGLVAPVEVTDELYNAGGESILGLIQELADDVRHVLLVGHAPGLPWVVHALADPETSDPAALQAIGHRFPAATLALLDLTGSWSELERGALRAVRLPS
jgi:phosphohistidine phosphatase